MDYSQSQITENIITIVKEISENSSESNLLPLIIFLFSIGIILIYLVKVEVNSNGTSWEKNKCSSKYVFFSGYMKNSGNALEQTLSNFNDCIVRFL